MNLDGTATLKDWKTKAPSLPRGLFRKSLIVIGLPLLLEVLFMVALGILVHLADRDVKSAQRQFEILQCCQDIEVNYGALLTWQTHFLKGADKKADRDIVRGLVNHISGDLDSLRELKLDRPVNLKRIAELQQELCCSPVLCRPWEDSEHPEKIVAASGFGIDLTHELQSLSASAENSLHERLIDQNRLREQIGQVIAGGVVFNILLAFALGIFFSRSIARRVKILSDNTVRLAQGEVLNPPVSGGDEIAFLDRAFHEMALRLESATKELAESEKALRTVIDNMPVGLITLTSDGIIESANPRAAQIFALSQAELSGIAASQFLPHFLPPALAAGVAGNIASVCQTGPHYLLRPDGKKLPVELATTEFTSPAGKRLLASIQDISARHKVEQLKREFIAMVGDDLKQPLLSIERSFSLLSGGRLGELPPAAANNIVSARDNVLRLIALINDLLDMEKMDSGKLEIALIDTALQPVLDRSLDAVRPVAEQKDIKIALPRTDLHVLGNADRLVQVVVNLLSNALKFSPPSSLVTVTVAGSDDYAEVRINDEGPGIPEQYQERIFDRFQQIDDSLQAHRNGSGLGLSICRAIITEHNGVIGVESEHSQGSTFWFRLPLAGRSAASAYRQPAQSGDDPPCPAPEQRTKP